MTKESLANEKVKEALELLNRAAIEKKDDLLILISGGYEQVKEVLSESARIPVALKETETRMALSVRRFVSTLEESVSKNPWRCVTVATLAGLVLGLIVPGFRTSK